VGLWLPFRLPSVVAIRLDKALQVFSLKPAVSSGAKTGYREESFVRPMPHRIGMNVQQVSHLSGGQHP